MHGDMTDLVHPSPPEPKGLSAAVARDRLREDGPNVLPDPGGWESTAHTNRDRYTRRRG